MYEVFCAILYLLKSGCQWCMLPEGHGNKFLPKTVNKSYGVMRAQNIMLFKGSFGPASRLYMRIRLAQSCAAYSNSAVWFYSEPYIYPHPRAHPKSSASILSTTPFLHDEAIPLNSTLYLKYNNVIHPSHLCLSQTVYTPHRCTRLVR